MTSEENYQKMLQHSQQIIRLSQAAGLLSWDQEAMMPKSGAQARGLQLAALANVIHQATIDPKFSEYLNAVDPSLLDEFGKTNLRETKIRIDHAKKLPTKLVVAQAELHSRAQAIWADARKNNSPNDFLPSLAEIVKLKREEAACLRTDHECLYDTLLDQFEPGARVSDLLPIFSRLRHGLTELRTAYFSRTHQAIAAPVGIPEGAQVAIAKQAASYLNFDWDAGRMDFATHPFCSGYRSDVRITARTNPLNFLECTYTTMHEVGHANYEQGRNPDLDGTPAGDYASSAVHESQSRLLENQIGRSRPFMDWLYPVIKPVLEQYNCGSAITSADQLYRLVNWVEPNFIRTEADELHYNLHILMRFDLERALIDGDLPVADLEEAWNTMFYKDFGHEVTQPSYGFLQDVHWSCGLFGYFPTYCIGNIYAAELFAKIREEVPDVDQAIATGQLFPIQEWLREKVHVHGKLYSPRDLIEQSIKRPVSEQALLTYLNGKFQRL